MSNVIAAFTVEQAASLALLSVSQLREWDNDGFFVPSMAIENRKSPYSRIYSFDDLVGLRTLSILRKDCDVSRQHLQKAAKRLMKHSGKPWSSLAIYVLKKEVHFFNPQTKQIEGAVTGQIAVPISLSSVADDMRSKSEAIRKRNPSSIGNIERNRFTMHGDPVIAGTRIPVSAIKSFFKAGYSIASINKEYPTLTIADIEAALHYGDNLTHAA